MRVFGADGATELDVCAEVATTESARHAGLAGRAVLEEGTGMLLDFPVTGEVCITGEAMRFPLDVLFMDDASRVTARGALGVDDATLICEPGVVQVLEVNGGAARNVAVGDPVEID